MSVSELPTSQQRLPKTVSVALLLNPLQAAARHRAMPDRSLARTLWPSWVLHRSSSGVRSACINGIAKRHSEPKTKNALAQLIGVKPAC